MNTSLNLRPVQSFTAALALRQAAIRPTARIRTALLGLLAVLGTAGSAMAQDAPTVKAKQPDAQSLWLTIENPAQQRVQMQVVALSNAVRLTTETNHLPSYGCQLNFRGVPAGQYAVLLRVGRERYRYNVQVQAQPQTTIAVPGLTAPQTDGIVASAAR